MAKLPFIPFYPADWLVDTRKLSAEAKGLWIDILCFAWNEEHRGIYFRTRSVMFRELGITAEKWDRKLVYEIGEVADVSEDKYDEITIVSRRMVKEEKKHENDRIRQWKHRRNASVTPLSLKSPQEKSEVRSQKSEVIKETTPPLPPKGGFDIIWAKYPSKTNSKAAKRHFQSSVKTMTDFLDIQRAIDNYLKSDRVKNGYIQNGSTWFNNWRDWINYEEEKNASDDSESFAIQLARRRAEIEAKKLREGEAAQKPVSSGV